MPTVSGSEIAFAKTCREKAEKVFPAVTEMFEGFLEAGKWDPDQFLVYFFARRQGLLRGCTNFAVLPEVTETGQMLAGRNYDWAYSDVPFCEARLLDVSGALSFVSYTHHWIGHPDCLNEAGVFVAISSLPAVEPVGPGVQWNILVDAIASACQSVSEAVTLLCEVSHLRSITYLVVDQNTAAAVEASPDGVSVRYPVDGIVVATNHSVGSADGSDRTRHSIVRYNQAEIRLRDRSPKITESDVLDVLSDPVCTIRDGKRFLHELDHVPLAAVENWGTIWSTLCCPANREIKIAEGHPEDTEYVRIAWDANTHHISEEA
jgi:predicted choloylglycine hydrolase